MKPEMLLDIQGDMNAIKNTMNELEKLSDEEKAEEITCKKFHITKNVLKNIIDGLIGKTYYERDIFYYYNGVLNGLAELKEQLEELQLNLRSRNDLVEELTMQNEKMKNFYNCSHSSRALCPNEHKCNGCKEWEMSE